MPKNKFLLFSIFWFMLTVYGLFLYIPNGLSTPPFPQFDKFTHCCLFFGQFWLLSKLYLIEQQRPPFKWLMIIAVIWAIATEAIQGMFTLTRTADVFDAIADILGALLALGLANYMMQLKQKIIRQKVNEY
ncbi:VanZ family protein [Neisseria sp. Ec49-e6-T10]|uniref:VanZ family protein n=1 Tax=Neisseria sp. Ec49-e6-T10 TaxID=3140744 RepID=UPI003EBC97A1